MAIDLFRGITILGMILVNCQGDYSSSFVWVRHANWDSITPADYIFPFFLFISGISIAIVFRKNIRTLSNNTVNRKYTKPILHIVFRSCFLILIGLILNGFPEFSFHDWRITGVLQRIGICYLFAALIYRYFPWQAQVACGILILAGYAVVLSVVSFPGGKAGLLLPENNIARWFDIAVFGSDHLFRFWPTEPEGLLSTPSAIVTMMLGTFCGSALLLFRRIAKRFLIMITMGSVLTISGCIWNQYLPAIKMIWTPSYVLLTSGIAMLFFALCLGIADLCKWKNFIRIFEVFGRNAIAAYIVSELLNIYSGALKIGKSGIPFAMFVMQKLMLFASPAAASLLYAAIFVVIVWLIMLILYKRKWFIKI